MIKKKLAIAISAALALGAAGVAQATVYTSTASGFTGDFVISGFADADPNVFQISLTNVNGALDLYVPKNGSATGQRIGTTSIDYTPAHAGADLVSAATNWTSMGSVTFDTTDITGNNFKYNFSSGSFTSDGVAQTGGSFTGTASALDLMLGSMFGPLGASIGTGSVSVTHTLSAHTWTINVSETAAGGTGFSGLFRTLDSVAYGGNKDGVINGSFSVNASVALNVADGAPVTGGTVTTPILPTPPTATTPVGTFTFENVAIGTITDAAGKVVGLDTAAPLWVDPVVAVGYRYELGATSTTKFATVQLPGLSTVNDTDGYEIWLFNGTNWYLGGTVAAGGIFTFPTGGVTKFEIRGISPDLGLLPTNDLAFPVGLTVTNPGTADLTMTALTVDTGTPVPAPDTLSLTGLGLAALGAIARRKKA